MNKTYRVIWNSTLRVFQVCSELVSGKYRTSSVCLVTSELTSPQDIHVPYPAPSRLRLLSLLVLMALPGMASADLTVDSNLGNSPLSVTQDNPVTDAGNIIVGSTSGGTGELIISNGGTVTGDYSTIGSVAGSTGTVTVDGAGSILNIAGMTVGNKGTGTLNITGGSSVITGSDSGGGTSIGIGSTATVDGVGSSLTYGYGGLEINGDLSITDGGQVTSPNNRGTANVNSGATLTVDGTDSMLTSGNFNVGAGGLMAVTSGGNVVTTGSSGDAINGTVTVDGAGSEWTNNGNFFMGNATGSTPTIAITNGGAVILAPGGQMMANNTSSSALITVDGAGSRLSSGGTFLMQGVNPTDPTTIQVTNGGALNSNGINIGRLAGDIARITVDGDGSTWTTTAATNIGLQGSGTVTLTNGAVMTSGSSITVGAQEGSTGTFDISGGSRVNAINAGGALQSLTVGGGGTGTLNIHTDSSVTAGSTNIGNGYYGDVGTGIVNVDGASAVLNTTSMNVGSNGYAGDGALNIINGGVVTSTGTGILGYVQDRSGTVDISSDGQWNLINASGIRQTLTVGNNGTGTLNVSTDGAVTAGVTTVGGAVAGSGTVNVSGADAALNTTALTVGSFGQGLLTIANNGVVNSTGAGIVGTAANSTGTVIVDGTGSQWDLTGTLTTGGSGTGTMTLTDNARVTSQGGTIGNAGAGNGTVDVSTGAEWNNGNGTLTVGNGATGTLNIHDTGVVDAAFTLLGGQASGEGTVNVVGPGAVLNAGALTVGQAGTGTLTVTDGGVVKTTGVTLGNAVGSSGTIDVSSGASWDNGMQILTVGNNSTGTVNIHDGGTITTGAALLGKSATGDGTVNVDGAGSILNLVNGNTYIGQSGKGALNITNGGVVEQNTPYGIFIADGSTVSVDGAGSTLSYNAGALWVTGDLSVTNGGLVNNIPAGIGISITGTAEVDGANSRLTGSNFTVNSGGTLDITQGGSTTITAYGVNRINGTVNVDGAGSTLDVSPALLYVGASSPGTTGVVRVTNGGAVTAVQTILGTYADDTADILVDGEGSTWTSISGLNVGSSGAATVTLTHTAVMDGLTSASIGTAAGSNGTVNASSGGQLNLVNASGAAQVLTVGNSGTGTLNINTTGTVTAGGSTIGSAATGVGTVNVNGQDSVLNTTGLTVGYGGLGTLNISDSGTVNSTGVGVVGSIANSTGTVDVNSGGTWNLVNNGVAQNLTVAQSGTGTLNIHANSSVTAGNTQLASAAGSIATVTVDGTNAVLNAGQVRLGVLGNASMTLSNGGTLSVTSNVPVSIASNGGGTGTLNIGAAHGESAAGAGFITGADSVNMGAGTGALVFNHTGTDYQFTPLITGNGTVMQDAGHTVLNTENTYSGTTQINGGTLTTTVQSTTGNTGLGTSAVNIAAPGTLEVAGATTDGSGNFTFSNLLTGSGLLSVDLAATDDTFAFAPSAGTAFAGVADLKNNTFALSGDNASALTDAMLMTSTGNTTTVSGGVQHTDGLAFNGGTLALDISLPGAAQSDGVLQTGTLVAGAGTFSRNGRDIQANGIGNVQVTLTDPWNDPGLTADPDTHLNLLQQDDTRPGIQLVQADTVTGSGGSLTLTDQNGNAIGTDETVAIAQNGTAVADGLYGIRMTTAPGDGLYINYGLKEVDIRTGQTLMLAEFAGATGADADMSAKVSGSGNLAVNTGGTVSLSNGLNDYSGATQIQAGTLRTDADGALGNTSELNISSGATADLNNTVQTARMLTGQAGSTLNINGGALTLANGGLSNGSLTGAGNLNVDGGVLTIDGANSGLSATTTIRSGAQVVINDVQGAGTGDITDDGILTLDGVTGALVNSLSGTGTVALSNETNISATADNALFAGVWDVQDASLLHFSSEENAGTATVRTHGAGTLSLDGYHGDLNNSVTGAGTVILTGNADVTATETGSQFTGTYDVQSGSTLHMNGTTLPSAAALNDNGLIDLTTTGAYTLQNVLTGTGILKADTAGEALDFASTAGNAFAGTVDLSNATLALGGVNTSALTNATLKANTGSIITVADGEQVIGGLAFAGGEMVFNVTLPDEKVAASHVTTTTLEASGTGTVQIAVPASYVPDHETSTTSSLMTQDEANIEVQLVSATQVTGSGGNLELRDQSGNTITDATQVNIAQGGSTVAKGTYDYRLTTTGTSGNQDGLYVNYGLKELELLQGQTLTLEGDPGATGAAADQSARITGSGNLAVSTTGSDVLSLSNSSNGYTGDTTVLSGTLRTDADGALGDTHSLNISSNATADLNGTLQTAGILNTQQDGTLALNAGTLNLTQGGNVKGEMTGDGQLNVNGGTLTVESVNTDMTAGVMIADGATVVLSSPDTMLGGQGARDVTVAEGGTLGGQGMVGGNVVNSGMLSAMNALPGYETGPAGRLTLGGNLTNSGTLNLAGSKTGNQLVVNGNYTGSDGLLALNTVLDGDDSPTDKLTVHGDTTGNTRVSVNRAGGTGAQTVNGIELVQVDGNSAGNFALVNGTVEAGAYVYTLAKGTGNGVKNWYLTSKWNGAVPVQDPPVVDPTAPDALRPEAGSYISNIAAANTLFNHRLHDRLGEPQYTDALKGDGLASSMWMRHVGGHERSSAGDGQLKTQSNRYVLQLGGDIAQWSTDGTDRWHLGVMGGYANEHSNTRSDRAGYGSDGRVSGYSAGLYGTWYQNEADKTGAYVDSWMLYNWFDSSVESDNRESDSYKSKGLTASVEAGYTLKAGEFTGSQGTLNTWYVQPQAQVTWMGVKADAHTRNDGTHIETQGDGNIQTRLGVRTYLNSHHKMDDGKQREFQPFVEVNWIHNTESFGVKMDGTKVSRDGARNLGEIRTGVEGKLNDRLSVWGNIGVQMGDKGYNDTQGMLGVKYSW